MEDLSRSELRMVAKAIDDAYAKGYAAAEAKFDALLARLRALKELNGTTELFKAQWDESKHNRDHGQFSSEPGGGSDRHDESATEQGDSSSAAPANPGPDPDQEHPADAKARSLLSKIASVPRAVREKVTKFVSDRYAGLKTKYGEVGAKAVLGATVLLAPIPVPGTAFIPVALAEAVLRIRRALGGVGKAVGEELDPGTLAREARTLLSDLYAEMGEEYPDEFDHHELRPGAETDDADPHAAIAEAMLAHAEECLESGDDPQPGVGRLLALADDPAELGRVLSEAGADEATTAKAVWVVLKAWSEESHPRDDHGRYVSKDAIADAKGDPKRAEELKKRVTDPEQRKKLDAALSGETDLGRTKRGQARHEAATRRRTRDEAKAKTQAILAHLKRVGDLKAKLTADHLYDLADHLTADGVTVEDVRAMRHALAGAGAGKASFGGESKKDAMVQALVAHAREKGFEARVKEHGLDEGEMRVAIRETPPPVDTPSTPEPTLEQLNGGPGPKRGPRDRGDPLSPAAGDRFAGTPVTDKPPPAKTSLTQETPTIPAEPAPEQPVPGGDAKTPLTPAAPQPPAPAPAEPAAGAVLAGVARVKSGESDNVAGATAGLESLSRADVGRVATAAGYPSLAGLPKGEAIRKLRDNLHAINAGRQRMADIAGTPKPATAPAEPAGDAEVPDDLAPAKKPKKTKR